MSDITRRATFYANPKRPVPKTFHIECDGVVVNIEVGLTDKDGHAVTRVDMITDGPERGGDGQGRVWVHPVGDSRIIRLHEWERAPGIPEKCICDRRHDFDTGEFGLEPDLSTCGSCGKSWCNRCTPTPSARCPFEDEHEEDQSTLNRYLVQRVERGLSKKGWSKMELARRTGVSHQYIYRIMSGREEGRLSRWDRMIEIVESED